MGNPKPKTGRVGGMSRRKFRRLSKNRIVQENVQGQGGCTMMDVLRDTRTNKPYSQPITVTKKETRDDG